MLALLVLVLSPTAFADDGGPLCTPIAQLEQKVNYCDENGAYVAPAEACRDQYKALVKKKNEEIKSNFAKLMKTANSKAQSGDFQANQALLASTESTLEDLIDQGFEIFDEMGDYQNDFVLPIYKGYPEDFSVDPHSPEGHELFGSKECWSGPMSDLEDVKADLKGTILELEKTQAKATELHALSKGKDTNLGSMNNGAAKGIGSGGGSAKGVPSGTSSNGSSSITGVDQAKKKDVQLPATNSAPATNP